MTHPLYFLFLFFIEKRLGQYWQNGIILRLHLTVKPKSIMV